MIKDRLIEAAVAIDRSGERITMNVVQGGVQVRLMRMVGNTWKISDKFTGWLGIEEARQNPLTQDIRDLINQMNELEEREL